MLRTAISRGRAVGASVWAQGGLLQQQAVRVFSSHTPSRLDLEGDITLQQARTWDEGVKSKFKTSSLAEIFQDKKVVIFGLPGAYTGVCSQQHVPSYVKLADKIKDKGVDQIICVSVNDPYVINAWAEGLKAKPSVEFYGDLDGSFHKHLGLECDLSGALLGPRSQRWSAYIVNGQIKVLNVEDAPSEFLVSDAETILKSIR
ncbi:unnamed protein product [Calypogeia fissa]